MASIQKQKGMVFHQEGADTPAAAPAGNHPPVCFAVPKPGKASEGGMEQSTHVTNKAAEMSGKPNMYSPKEAIKTFVGLPAMKHPTSSNPQSDILSPDGFSKGIRVTLDNNSMWNEFFRCKTEMILTKQGSRMFPYCRFRMSGLQPSKKYSLIMDIQALDNSRYKWTGKSWQVAGKAESHVKSEPFVHPESPSTGQHWMQNPVSFYKLKLTNNSTDQEGNTILHPMHRYLPRLHVVLTDRTPKHIMLNGPNIVTFTFPQTEFMAVTAYQNSEFAQLKVDYNPFTKGLKEDGSSPWSLKLKLNSGKDSQKDGGTTTHEQLPLKKSLKSLLANHKPRSAKGVDSKPLASDDLQKKSTTNKDQAATKVPEECCNSRPAQKLFSELIREAHVSLQRCNMEQLASSNSTSHTNEQTNTKPTVVNRKGQDESQRDIISANTHRDTSPAKKGDTVTKINVKDHKDHFSSLNCKNIVKVDYSKVGNTLAASAVSHDSSVEHQPETQSEDKVKQHKRPAPLPLPALARFLKQHSTKSKKAKNKLDSPPPILPAESEFELHSSVAASAHQSSECPGNASSNIANSDQIYGYTSPHLVEMVCNVNEQAAEITDEPSSPIYLDATTVTDSISDSNQPFCTSEISLSNFSSTRTTSPQSHILTPSLDTVLPAPNSPQTPSITEQSSTLPLDSPTMKSDSSILLDPECSSFGFEPLSPASSPEPLPSLPALLTSQLDSTTSEPTQKSLPPEELPHSEDTASVFKWHTVLPLPERYMDTSFTTFQPTAQTIPLVPVTSPLLPSQTPPYLDPQTFDTATSTPASDPVPTFQDHEQSLLFPAELSPLALQLPLSPTFSSLDGGVLSPTPSLTDLVHFFSADDLGMGVDFSNTDSVAVPCPPPITVEAELHEISQQVQPVLVNKPSKRKKKSQRQKLAMTEVDQKMDDSTYTSMQPNLEEVEEQLFISFTSKEALKLHVLDSPEETVSQPQTPPEGHLQQITDAPENDKSPELSGTTLPDSIHPHNFPAKLWRLVNSPENKAICWDSDGDIIIIDQRLFETQILSPSSVASDAFKTSNFSSFVRQLNLYGFRKVDPAHKDNPHPDGYSGICHRFTNPNFNRNHPELVASLRRLTVNNKAKLQAGLSVTCRPPGQHQRLNVGDDGGNKTETKRAESAESAETLEEKIATFEMILLRDLKFMRHRQVIHPVLQEVGLKLNLLDPTLTIDLQYLGVRLPIPPPGDTLEPLSPELLPTQSVSAAFVSRTGKTTDMTQIKGWREKFTPSEAPPAQAPPKPEAAPSSDLPKKNLSAFCSDMLDEYLENEGKLIDERASSFSQPVVEPVVYELPTRSTSYVRTFDNVLKKHTSSAPSDLISGFVPPSKRPKLGIKETKTFRRERQKPQKPRRPSAELAAAPNSGESSPVSTQPAAQVRDSTQSPTFKKRTKLKPKTLSQTLSPLRSTGPPSSVSEDMAPLESDSELRPTNDPSTEGCRKSGGPIMTRTLLRQKDLEDGVLWEGRHRTSVTEERATIALTSLFTLMGFVRENPTAPIQLLRRQAPPCLNDFCRLGCICSSLSYCSRISHCGRPACMFGCSCLKQKVVMLKNLDGSDSSPSYHGNIRKRKRKRRMKMAYILKEAESVSKPAQRVRILWRRDSPDFDPDPLHVPEAASLTRRQEKVKAHKERTGGDLSSCARVRAYKGRKKIRSPGQKEPPKVLKTKRGRLKSLKHRLSSDKETRNKPTSPPPVGESVQPPSPQTEPPPKPSKRLIILAECKWQSDSDRNHVLKELCEKMALDQLDKPFWIKKYLISPSSQTVDGSGIDSCIQYKIHITRPQLDPQKPAQQDKQETKEQQVALQPVASKAEPLDDWHCSVKDEEAEPLEDWQREVEEDEEEETLDDWQREVEEEDIEEVGPTVDQVHDGRERSREEFEMRLEKSMKKRMKAGLALPFLTGISPAGFLSANKKQPGDTDHAVRVNGKLYPLAKIQLGKMGALHPANRLAAYLTGRVGSCTKKQAPSTSVPKPPQNQSSGPPPQIPAPASSACSSLGSVLTPISEPSLAVLPTPTSSTDSRVSSSVLPSASRTPKGSQLFVVHAPPLPGKVPGLAARSATTQKMVLQQVKTVSGMKYYRTPTGQLVQLVPIKQLRSANPSQSVQSVLPAELRQTPAGTVVDQTPSVITSSSSSSSSSAFLSQQPCTFKIIPTNSTKEPVIAGEAGEIPPGSFTLLQPYPPTDPGAKPGVKMVTLAMVPTGQSGMVVQQKPASPQTTAGTSHKHPPAPPLPGVTPLALTPHPEPASAINPMDLDVSCVDENVGEVKQPVEVVVVLDDSKSSEAELSDVRDEMDSREKKDPTGSQRRAKLHQLFEGLRREVGQSEELSKSNTLKKAVEVIEELRTAEQDLMSTKWKLMKTRDHLLSTVIPTPDEEDELTDHSSDDETVVTNVDTPNRPAGTTGNKDSESGLAEETAVEAKNIRAAFRDLSSVLGAENCPRSLLLHKAHQEIRALQSDTMRLRSQKICLKQQRDTYVRQIAQSSGISEKRILQKLQHLSSVQKYMMHQHPAAEGGATSHDTLNSIQAPPTPVFPPPSSQTGQTAFQQLKTQTQTFLQVSNPTLAPHGVSHNAPVMWERPRTVPNILSRSKNRANQMLYVLKNPVKEPFQGGLPIEVLSLVAAALPQQQVMTLNPVMARPTVLQTAPALNAVTLNIPSLTNQQIHVTSLPHPPTAPVTITNLTAENFLQFVQPSTMQQPQKQHQQQDQHPPQHEQHEAQQLPPAAPPAAPPAPPSVVSAGSDHSRNQNQPPSQTSSKPESSSSVSQCPRRSEDPDSESLTSLLSEIDFLNQQPVNMTEQEDDPAHSPWVLQLDSDSDDNITRNMEEATKQDIQQPAGVLAPPPLLQMKMGGAKVVDPASRPMPRLVPLGLRGNPAS